LACSPASQSPSTDVAATVPSTDKPFGDNNGFHFAVMGDRTGGARPGIFPKAVETVNHLGPDFVMSVGDYIEGYSDDVKLLTQEWDDFDAELNALEMRFFFTPGNHDYSNAAMSKLWEERLGRAYYHFVYKDVLFLVLNTEDPPVTLSPEIMERSAAFKKAFYADPEGTQARVLEAVRGRADAAKLPGSVAISDEQIAYMKTALSDNPDVRWTFLLMHKPAWQYQSEAFASLETVLKDRPYTVLAGHEHYYSHEERLGRDYIVMATCGGVWLKDGPGQKDHITWITMGRKQPRISNISLNSVTGRTSLD